ncbi:hypothetical protein F4802DRAFT_604839 [Xylaria palmicola]|nr:hypothetical protein F4802DRAFT_604839 [Xylaria palmicola]
MDYLKARTDDMLARSKAAFEVTISQNPEKIRTILNFLFVPEFKPTFESDSEGEDSAVAAATEFDSVDLLAPSFSSSIGDPGGLQNRFPYRMIDLDTGALVVRPEIGTFGQYCILSHSWKFPEVTYQHLTAARSKTFAKTVESGKVVHVTRLSDIEVTKRCCWSELVEQEEEVKRLVHESDALSKLGVTSDDSIIEVLLKWLKDVREAERGLNGQGGEEKAKKALADAIAAEQYQRIETGALSDLLVDIGLDKGSIETAARILGEHKAARIRQADKIKFFNQYGHIRNALDRLVNCKRYVWIDTCCIDKDDDGEYVRSISAMGDWYKNAEFCLVHLDSPKDFAQEWLEDWEMFSPKAHAWVKDWDLFDLRDVRPEANIATYGDISQYKPQWSTRAWTLQELVMSKTTYFVNSSWAFLNRPVEKLGYWYYLCPFVSLYSDLDIKNPFLGLIHDAKGVEELARVADQGTIENKPVDFEPLDTAIGKAQRLIAMLEAMDFRIRGDIDLYTARAWVTQAVNITSSSLGATSTALLTRILDVLKSATEASAEEYLPSDPTTIRHVIGIILKCIVHLIEQPIMEDRGYIAEFGNVENLGMWHRGLVRSNFSTAKSMALMCPRDATEEIDRAYGLMGMLGVRFPTFKAEGLTKALSRLLDEVVITSNDVSVFNWTGKQYGSPLRGRSLYPSMPEAYSPSQEENRKKAMENRLAGLLQIERYERLNEFEQIQGMLLGVLEFLKSNRLSAHRLSWLRDILKIFKRREFKHLKPHIKNMGKILKYIETKVDDVVTLNTGTGPGGVAGSVASSYAARPLETLSSSLTSLSSQVKIPSFPKDAMSFKAPKFGLKKSASETATPPTSSGRGIGGFKAPSLKGFGLKNTENTPAGTPKEENPAAALDSPASLPSAASAGIDDEKGRLERERSEVVDSQVLSYIQSVESKDDKNDDPGALDQASKLPPELENVLAGIPERKFPRPTVEPEDVETMISPNPILVKSSGIEGLFDIQRVVVTMPQSSKLRRQVKNAVSPTQKITGWCSISTGFAMVFVSFSCPKNILDQELDIVQAVEAKVLRQQESDDDDETDDDGEAGDIDEDVKEKPGPGAPKRPGMKRRGTSRLQRRLALMEGGKTEEDKSKQANELMTDEVEQEGKRVSRMIRFVQEPALSLVAGEWVLARFSGVPGAKWFLCHLDMGSSGRDFYGYRIATDEINFRNASPELGLMKYWENYMMQKKYRLCSLIQKLHELKQDLTTKITEKANQGIAGASGSAGAKSGNEKQDQDNNNDSDSDSNGDTFTNTLKELGGLAATMAGAGVAQTFYERWSSRLEKSLNADVLKLFPAHMQTALQSLDDNRDLMPSMFHSAKKIHMF